MKFNSSFWFASMLLCVRSALAAQPDILIADFEGEDYGAWTVTGKAFGPGPARGTLPNQMAVSGYEGRGLVNSFYQGDDTTGTLTSPSFRIERPFLNFLLGGGRHPGKTCINLLVDGQVIRTASGPNDQPGGSERLDWRTWDVGEFVGRMGVIQIVDLQTGGWGHLNVDQIVQSDLKRQAEPAQRLFLIDKHYLHLPVKTGAPKRRLKYEIAGKTVREFEIELADGNPDFFALSDVSPFRGQSLRLEADALAGDSKALASIIQSDDLPGADRIYREPFRPQFHFTSRRGWHNDPNGLVFYQGEYHLFYQHNPYGWNWGNMHWGHAVSPDLIQWKELPEAIYPRRFGDWVFSGSALVDWKNTAGFKKGTNDVLIAAYTSTGRGECIACSNDRGRTWQDYEGDPVVRHQGRDPKVIWHEPTQRWIMAVYDEFEGKHWIAFYASPDLKHWQFQSRIEGFFECPDFFEMPVQGDSHLKYWVLYAADGKYVLGQFDGQAFHGSTDRHTLWYGNFYAAQTYSDAPDGRRIQIGWGRGITFPGMPFNQQMTIACELTLRPTGEGVRLFAQPVPEIAVLRQKEHSWKRFNLEPGANPLSGIHHDLLDIESEFIPGPSGSFGFDIRGTRLVYDVPSQKLTCGKQRVSLKTAAGALGLRILVDRGSIEVFGNNGQVALSLGVLHPAGQHSLAVFSEGGAVEVSQLEVHELRSIWP
jgi:fructan beta-fructosidase